MKRFCCCFFKKKKHSDISNSDLKEALNEDASTHEYDSISPRKYSINNDNPILKRSFRSFSTNSEDTIDNNIIPRKKKVYFE